MKTETKDALTSNKYFGEKRWTSVMSKQALYFFSKTFFFVYTENVFIPRRLCMYARKNFAIESHNGRDNYTKS